MSRQSSTTPWVTCAGLRTALFPAALDSDGLAAAVEVLAVEEPRLVCGQLPDGRFTAPVESAAYHLVDRGVADGHRRATSRSTRGGSTGTCWSRSDSAAGFGALPERVADRIGAAGGTVAADSRAVRAELPCGS